MSGSSGSVITAASLAKAFGEDLVNELGFTRQDKLTKKRLDALKDPETYNTDRQTAIKTLTDQLGTTYESDVKYYSDAGYGLDQSKALAKSKAAQHARMGMADINLTMPPLTGSIMHQAGGNWAAAADPFGASQPRAAPRRRAPARKKKPAKRRARR